MNYLIKIQSCLFVLKWKLKKPFIILNKIRKAHKVHRQGGSSFWDVLSQPSSPNSPWGLWEEAVFMAGVALSFEGKTPEQCYRLMADEEKYAAYLEDRIELHSSYPAHVVTAKLEHYFEER